MTAAMAKLQRLLIRGCKGRMMATYLKKAADSGDKVAKLNQFQGGERVESLFANKLITRNAQGHPKN